MENNTSEKYEVNPKDFDYQFAINESYEVNEDKFVSITKIRKEKNKIRLPFIFYIFIFSSILFVGALITLLIIFLNKKPNYDIYNDPYIKPSISEHNYSKLIFHNGLEIVLTQVNYNDSAGGAISFEKGYLNQEYDPGYLKLVFYSFRNNERNSSRYLIYYMGDSKKATEEFYSTIYFKILNSGFQNYLKNFTNQVKNEVNETNITNFIRRLASRMDTFKPPLNDLNEKEKHLIEYLVYGIAYKNGSDIWRQCINFEEFDINQINIEQIKKIVSDLFIPKKVKMVFHSHYKMSRMRKIVIKDVKPLSNLPGTNDNEIKENFTEFSTNKIIYHQIDKKENHYIKINYYVDGANNNLSELYKDSGYFDYIKYILDENHKESLYYKLTHFESDNIKLNIKSFSCNFEVVLKRKIRFTILIELNIYSYEYLKEIIEIVYNYMEKIKTHINNLDSNDERINELHKVKELNFTFMEDVHEMEYFKNKAKDLFYRDDKEYYLKEVSIPPDLNKNISKMKFYFDQLTIENSVIFVSISKDIIDEYNLRNKSCSFIFSNLKNTTGFSNIVYSVHDIKELNLNILKVSDDFKLTYYPNEFISDFNTDTQISKDEEETNGIYTSLNSSDKISQFYWQKHTKFGVPKVFVNLYFFHPFLRPNSTDQNEQDYIFFHEMLYISYLKRELYFILGDAIRAGASLEIGFNENFFFIDASYYSDKIKKILEIIHEKIVSQKCDIIADKLNLELYKDYALNNLLKFDNIDIRDVLRYEFYISITEGQDDIPPVYNFYKFNKTNFEDFTISKEYLNYINAPIVRGFIFGYCEKSEAEDIYNIFKLGFNENSFQYPLMSAKYSNIAYPPEIFIRNCLNRSKLKKNITNNNIKELKGNMFSFMNFAKYSYENRIVVELFKKIGQHNSARKYRIDSIHQKDISLQFNISKRYYENTEQFQQNILKNIEDNMEYYTKEKFDVVGDYFYYIVTNLEIEYSKTPNNMKNCSFSYSYNELYGLYNIEEPSYKIDRNNYKNFTDTIKIIFEKYPNYYQFSNDQID